MRSGEIVIAADVGFLRLHPLKVATLVRIPLGLQIAVDPVWGSSWADRGDGRSPP
jgi:hypothetical protein